MSHVFLSLLSFSNLSQLSFSFFILKYSVLLPSLMEFSLSFLCPCSANLNSEYFHQRQDRYVVIRNAQRFADYLCSLVSIAAAHSYALQQDGSLTFQSSPTSALRHLRPDGESAFTSHLIPDPLVVANREKFYSSLRQMYQSVKETAQPDTSTASDFSHSAGSCPDSIKSTAAAGCADTGSSTRQSFSSDPDTVVYPFLQLGVAGITDDEMATCTLLERCTKMSYSMRLASGYFNLTPKYSTTLLRNNDGDVCKSMDILLASPLVRRLWRL